MDMNMEFRCKLPIPMEIKERFPASEAVLSAVDNAVNEMARIFTGKSDKMILVIGPCSADSEKPVLDYIMRLRRVQDKVTDKLLIVPRIYTNKPRTTGDGYKGMLHQPDPNAEPDMLKGVIAIRQLHLKAIEQSGFGCADEMLYPVNYRYLSDILAYSAVGARSVENQEHRLTASGLNIPVGLKNPTSGDITVMMNSIKAAQHSHVFCYRGWEVRTQGNPLSHAILRGYVDKGGVAHPNYHYEDLYSLYETYQASGLMNPAVIVDTNHSNSNKRYLEQPRIAKEILHSCRYSPEVRSLVKGLMIESYIEDGAQKSCDVYGKSITDPCLDWEKTERLIYDIADAL